MAAKDSARGSDHTHTLTVGPDAGFSSGELEREWVLLVVEGPDRGARVVLGDETLVIGSATTADLVLHDGGVSRRHLEAAVVPGGVRLLDLDSKNGTQLLGARLSAAVVGVGAEVRLGNTVLRIDDAEAGDDVAEAERFGAFTTSAMAQRRVFGTLGRIAPSDVSVLLEGEPGTGKRVLARALHDASARAARPMVEVEIGSLDAAAVGPALLGRADLPGAVERAHGGTLALYAVNALPIALHAPLARVLDEGSVQRVGDTRSRPADVRVVATSTTSLNAAVRTGRFLAALRDALSGVRVHIPALSERQGDLLQLVRVFAAEAGFRGDVEERDAARLASHRFDDNVRGLRELVTRAVATAGSGALSLALEVPQAVVTLRDEREAFERKKLEDLLAQHEGNVSAAARAAGIDRRHFHRLLKKHGLRGG